jgi:exopolyphosphatase/guanosine-5'-triphosphate,3'-diphosphate pyrophosphatase
VLDEALTAYAPGSWDVSYGSSGTIGAVADILGALGGSPGEITRTGLDWLVQQMVQARSAERLRLPLLKDDRRPVIGGGVSVLRAVFSLQQIERMQAAQGALRHGVLYDMLERADAATDVRTRTVQRLAAQFGTDAAQAERVRKVASHFLRQLRPAGADLEQLERKLEWAARVHEIGSLISHSDAHKHGAYILDNADAPGFSQHELHGLSLLVLGHRGKLRKLEVDFDDPEFVQQLLCLRLAVILCHARRDPDLKGLALRAGDHEARLAPRRGWAQAWPQSAHLLREECVAWLRTPWSFVLE